MSTREIRRYGRKADIHPVPNLVQLQTACYQRFLQKDVAPEAREDVGLQGVIQESFPILSHDGTASLNFVDYSLGRPRYTPEECRKLRLTYGRPFKIRVRFEKGGNKVEEEVYLGELPIMIGEERIAGDKKIHSCWIIPERGSWIELNVSKKDTLTIKIDQSGKFSAMTFLRAMAPKYSTNADLLRAFYETETVALKSRGAAKKLIGRHVVDDLIDMETGEVVLEAGHAIEERHEEALVSGERPEIDLLSDVTDTLVLNSLAEDTSSSHEEALLKIYGGNPPQLEKARALFAEKFFDSNRYRLGRVGRFRLNRKFDQDLDSGEMTLNPLDIVNAVRYILVLRKGTGEIDDIDHLGNRRIRTIDELASDEIRKGFLKLRRTVTERMSIDESDNITPRGIINSKTISSAIDFFFGRGELSQVVDQTNPLAQLTHERRLSALGPGGLNRKRAGFEVRDVHISHYGRICPIETPEGTNIGLIASLGIYATVDEYGFLTTPYRRVTKGKVTEEVVFLRADEEVVSCLAPADMVQRA
jgi:DNA-directed RNA polymerase subunit beta